MGCRGVNIQKTKKNAKNNNSKSNYKIGFFEFLLYEFFFTNFINYQKIQKKRIIYIQ
jgi:hypothetical protein